MLFGKAFVKGSELSVELLISFRHRFFQGVKNRAVISIYRVSNLCQTVSGVSENLPQEPAHVDCLLGARAVEEFFRRNLEGSAKLLCEEVHTFFEFLACLLTQELQAILISNSRQFFRCVFRHDASLPHRDQAVLWCGVRVS